jgi:ABC-type lipoprotein export system ATPase subunit
MIEKRIISSSKLYVLLEKYPFVNSFFENNNYDVSSHGDYTFPQFLSTFSEEELEDRAIDKAEALQQLCDFIDSMLAFLGEDKTEVNTLTLYPGTNKLGEAEPFEALTISKGDIISIVGPTGSGKSRLLADIEWVAQRDTPTKRLIYINGEEPDKKWRFSIEDKLVAQLSQNMNFVMDLNVYEFIELHAQSRMVENVEQIIEKIFAKANELAGEAFHLETPITSLSGGQSRALMIADTAILSKSPIVLIDEIENAGIDRKKALDLLLSEEKIVMMATHDPTLALLGDRRIVIQKGGIHKIIETTDEERGVLAELEEMDTKIQNMRNRLRYGKKLID